VEFDLFAAFWLGVALGFAINTWLLPPIVESLAHARRRRW